LDTDGDEFGLVVLHVLLKIELRDMRRIALETSFVDLSEAFFVE
jgi:hypothetical protein